MPKIEAPTPATGRLITRKRAADLLSVSTSTIDRMIKNGTFTRVKFGNNIQSGARLKLAEVEAFSNQ